MLNNKTSFELLYKKEPVYDHLRNFGCPCFASTLVVNRNKFDPIVMKCVLLGYPLGTKGYRLLDLSTRKVFNSRNVRFYGNVFPLTGKVKTHKIVDELFKEHLNDLLVSNNDTIIYDIIPSERVSGSSSYYISSSIEYHAELAEELHDITISTQFQ